MVIVLLGELLAGVPLFQKTLIIYFLNTNTVNYIQRYAAVSFKQAVRIDCIKS